MDLDPCHRPRSRYTSGIKGGPLLHGSDVFYCSYNDKGKNDFVSKADRDSGLPTCIENFYRIESNVDKKMTAEYGNNLVNKAVKVNPYTIPR